MSFVFFINRAVSTEDSAAATATGNPFGIIIIFCLECISFWNYLMLIGQ